MDDEVILATAVILAIGVGAQWLGWRARIPPIVFLLAAGLFVGPITGIVEPDAILGDLLFPVVSMAVAVILFEGALSLGGVQGLRDAGSTVVRLLTVGAGITLIATTLTARWVFDIQWSLAWLLAGVLVVTGPTVVGPLVRAIGLKGRVAKVLEAEGTLIDPVGAILAVLFFEGFFEEEVTGPWPLALLLTVVIGLVAGAAGAALIGWGFGRYLVPDHLHNVMTLATVLLVFAVADELQPEAGLVAVTAMGVMLGSQSRVSVDHVLEFNETLRTLFISGLFILLGARIAPETLSSLGWKNGLFLVVLVVLVRPLSVFASTMFSKLPWRERSFIASTAPRGIVAAAIASIFSLRLAETDETGAQVLVAATFTVIAGTVLLSGLTARPLAKRLGLIMDASSRTVVLGSNRTARELAHALADLGNEVTLVGMDRRNLRSARMDGLSTCYGSVVHDETWEEAGVEGSGLFLAMSSQDEVNLLATRRAEQMIGRRQVFQLVPRPRKAERGYGAPVPAYGRPLFAHDATIDKLDARLEDGWEITSTKITDTFGSKDYFAEHPAAMVLAVLRRGEVQMHDAGQRPAPEPGDTVISLLPPSDLESRFIRRTAREHPFADADDLPEPPEILARPPRDPNRLSGT
ncbi:MAG: cation:proton antiporter [Microthrixaceae bacterium]